MLGKKTFRRAASSDEEGVIRKIWNFLKADTWQSWLVSLVLVVIIIKFVFFPLLSLATGSPLPLVVVESCSMYHETNYDDWYQKNAAWYEPKQITRSVFNSFPFKNGLTKGDIIFVWGYSKPKLGDIIIFKPNEDSNAKNPIIHRVVSLDPLATKGDHNSEQLTKHNNMQALDETKINPDQVIGKSVFKIPVLGWIKLIFFEPLRSPNDRGPCWYQESH
jgi:signal peptidase I